MSLIDTLASFCRELASDPNQSVKQVNDGIRRGIAFNFTGKDDANLLLFASCESARNGTLKEVYVALDQGETPGEKFEGAKSKVKFIDNAEDTPIGVADEVSMEGGGFKKIANYNSEARTKMQGVFKDLIAKARSRLKNGPVYIDVGNKAHRKSGVRKN